MRSSVNNPFCDSGVSPPTQHSVEPLIDAHEAAHILHLHSATVRQMAGRGEIPGLKIGKVWRFRASSLDEWVRSKLNCAIARSRVETER